MPGVRMQQRSGYSRVDVLAPSLISYSTLFSSAQTPLSESGAWKTGLTHGLDWTDVVTSGGFAYGTQDGLASPEFNDSVACLSGFPVDHEISGIVRRTGTITGIQEIELLTRWSINAHVIHGYEMLWAHDGAYSGVVRWDAATPGGTGVGDGFVSIGGAGPTGYSPADGDELKVRIVGNVLTVYVNGSLFHTVSNIDISDGTVYSTGNPGIGFFRKNNGGSTNPQNLCFTSISAVGI